MQYPLRMIAIAEITAFTAVVMSYIWLWRGSFAGDFLFVTAMYFGIGYLGHARRGESLRHIGFRFDNWQPAARNAALIIVTGVSVALIAGTVLDSWHFPSWTSAVAGLLAGVVWATVQQYGLLCVLYRRLHEALGSTHAAMAGAGVLFALFHLPNSFLAAVTLAAGMVACALYRRQPNVLVIGIAHAAISFALYYALPESVTGGLRVGPSYYTALE